MSNRAISIISGAAFILAASGSAFAADMGVPPAPPPAPVYNWTNGGTEILGRITMLFFVGTLKVALNTNHSIFAV
jgi:hypothetical protein